MKKAKTLVTLLMIFTLLLYIFPVSAEGSAFSFRNGISFGMSAEQLMEAEAAGNGISTDSWDFEMLYEWQAMTTSYIPVSDYEALFLYLLYNNEMEMACYNFTGNDEGEFEALSAALSSLYGEAKATPSEVIAGVMDLFSPGFYSPSDITSGLTWKTDSVVIYQFFFAENQFAIVYMNPYYDYSAVNAGPAETEMPAAGTNGL